MRFSPRRAAGDFDALVAVLDPDAVFRVDAGADSRAGARPDHRRSRGGGTGAGARLAFAPHARPALVNGTAGFVVGSGTRSSPSSGSPLRTVGSSRST